MARSWSWWSAAWVWLGRWWMLPITVLLLAAAAALWGLRSRHLTLSLRVVTDPGAEEMPALTPRAILLGGFVLLALGVTAAVLLLVNFSGTEPRDRLDAIRTAATLLVGTGGAAALLLAARRQRAAELTLALERKAAADTAHDAAARRITELYLKAVEQLGSDKAAVRHGGLYALERVAQDNPDQRQTVISVICAYLRSPYAPPPVQHAARRAGLSAAARRGTAADRVAARAAAARRASLTPPLPAVASEQLRQEREVRLTAQRILTSHLCPAFDRTDQPHLWYSPNDYDLDLTGATLIDFHAIAFGVRQATFTNAHFSGAATFVAATFIPAWFDGATFTGVVRFDEARFTNVARFDGARFSDHARFDGAKFTDMARFDGARFSDHARFDGAKFTDHAVFVEATFNGDAQFDGATFHGVARFTKATFHGVARFTKATFTNVAEMAGASAAAAFAGRCVWPPGWTVDDHAEGTAAPGEALGMLRLVPVPVVLASAEPGDGFQSGRADNSPE